MKKKRTGEEKEEVEEEKRQTKQTVGRNVNFSEEGS